MRKFQHYVLAQQLLPAEETLGCKIRKVERSLECAFDERVPAGVYSDIFPKQACIFPKQACRAGKNGCWWGSQRVPVSTVGPEKGRANV